MQHKKVDIAENKMRHAKRSGEAGEEENNKKVKG